MGNSRSKSSDQKKTYGGIGCGLLIIVLCVVAILVNELTAYEKPSGTTVPPFRTCGWDVTRTCGSIDCKKDSLAKVSYKDFCDVAKVGCEVGCTLTNLLDTKDYNRCYRECVAESAGCRSYYAGIAWLIFVIIAILLALVASGCLFGSKGGAGGSFIAAVVFMILALVVWYFVSVVKPYGICSNNLSGLGIDIQIGVSNWLLIVGVVFGFVSLFCSC
mmetsp:Transcript_77757/g.95251  ORF Transcript_77757/g.95251 Transcript_77757/m.95251 type:complete len:217 (-) Transcript_77757:118-768(-)